MLDLAAQTTVTYTITGAVASDISDPLLCQVVLTPPSAFGDLASDNNQAADSNIVTPLISMCMVETILPEGNAGEMLFTFLIERRGDREQPIEIPYSIAGTGVNPANSFDFGSTFPDGVVRLAAGEASGFITLGIVGDFLLEPTEAFSLTLLSPSTGVIIGPTTASGTIQDDDFLFAYSVALVKKPDNTEANDDSAAAAALLLDYSAETDSEGGDEHSHTNVNTAGEEGLSLSRAGQRWSQEAEDLRASLGEVRLFFVQVDVSGSESVQKYALPVNMLEGDRLLELFKKFPNGHYRVYLEQDRSLRKLYDLHIYGHQLTTPEVPSAQPPTSEEAAVAPPGLGLETAVPESATSDSASG